MSEQGILIATLIVLMGLLIWGKWRYDGVTLVCLAALVLFGVVPVESAFSGFGHPAVITVALVLLISRGLQEAGMVSLAGNLMSRLTLSENQYMIMIMIVAAFLSSFMNNIGAMALLLPITLSLCQKMEWNPSKFLMPLAFASILGGMNTVIGTPPNIIIAQYRQEYTGVAFNFFDYSFVGLAVSILGVLFIALIGFRFVKVRKNDNETTRLIDLKNYLFEVTVKENSKAIGMRLSEIKKISGPETEVLGVVNETGGVSRVSMSKKFNLVKSWLLKLLQIIFPLFKSLLGLKFRMIWLRLKNLTWQKLRSWLLQDLGLWAENMNFLKGLLQKILHCWGCGAKVQNLEPDLLEKHLRLEMFYC